MKVVVLYRPNSEHGRTVEEFVNNFRSQHREPPLEVLNIDSRDGSSTATLYDIMQYPAIMVVQTDGTLHKLWEGAQLPLLDEVVAYAHA